jgi:hypothetical protein
MYYGSTILREAVVAVFFIYAAPIIVYIIYLHRVECHFAVFAPLIQPFYSIGFCRKYPAPKAMSYPMS